MYTMAYAHRRLVCSNLKQIKLHEIASRDKYRHPFDREGKKKVATNERNKQNRIEKSESKSQKKHT